MFNYEVIYCIVLPDPDGLWAEEKTMGIQEQDTLNFRETLAIPDSDGFG